MVRGMAHGFAKEFVEDPNPTPARGRVKVVAECRCGEGCEAFAPSRIQAWSRSIQRLQDHIISESFQNPDNRGT